MTIGVYDKNETRRFDADFTDSAGNAADPTTVFLRITKPDGSVVVHQGTGSPSELVNDATGSWYCDVMLDQVGHWYLQWEGYGNVLAIEPTQVYVKGTGY